MGIAKGVSLGPYEILTHIGAGGMGDVWRARDNRIGRDVAVKVLPDAYGEGDERVQRFEQEARAAGALNHPGLVTIFDVGTTEGAPYIVMELLEGQTLRDALGHITPVPLPIKKVIDYGHQIASALAVAHEKGIIHRDLKPENLFITADGRVKILDFGLAKLAADAREVGPGHRTARHLTSAGMVVGTPGYMAPEQVRAQALDARTDIFVLGTVMYEMLTGQSPFERDSAVETMHAVMNVEPPPLAPLNPKIPPSLDVIVSHCMEKNPRDRFQSARDLAFQLRTLPDVPTTATDVRWQPATARRLPKRLGLALVAATAIAAAGYSLYRVNFTSEEKPRMFRQLTFADGLETFPTLAPDGKSFAYVSAQSGNRDIYVQRVDGRTAINITSDSADDDTEPAFSPDGSQIAFRSERFGGGIFVMGVTGESVRRVTDFGHNPSWSPDGTRIVVSTLGTNFYPQYHLSTGHLWVIDTRTGAKRLLFKGRAGGGGIAADSDALQPSWSPHGHRIAFWGVSRLGKREIWTIAPDARDPKGTVVRVTSDPALHWNPIWSPNGQYLYFGSDGDGTLNLWRVAMDEESGTPKGNPKNLSLPASKSGHYAFSRQGELAFTSVSYLYRLLAVPVDTRSAIPGTPQVVLAGTQDIMSYDPSPDGTMVAFTTSGAQEDLFVANADGTRLRQLTNDPARDRAVSWTPDGETLLFQSNRNGAYHIWSVRADGSNLTRLSDGRPLYNPNASPDGKILAVHPAAFVHLDRPMAQRVEEIRKTIHSPEWSPDGKYLVGGAFSDAGPRFGLAVYSPATKQLEKVLDRGFAPRWLSDGRIAYVDRQSLGYLDFETREVTMHPFTEIAGVHLEDPVVPRFSSDGARLYVRQTLEQGDVWFVRLED